MENKHICSVGSFLLPHTVQPRANTSWHLPSFGAERIISVQEIIIIIIVIVVVTTISSSSNLILNIILVRVNVCNITPTIQPNSASYPPRDNRMCSTSPAAERRYYINGDGEYTHYCLLPLVWARAVMTASDCNHGWNEVTLRRARLVLRWVTACGQVNHLGAKPAR